jgi:hypothetical protein
MNRIVRSNIRILRSNSGGPPPPNSGAGIGKIVATGAVVGAGSYYAYTQMNTTESIPQSRRISLNEFKNQQKNLEKLSTTTPKNNSTEPKVDQTEPTPDEENAKEAESVTEAQTVTEESQTVITDEPGVPDEPVVLDEPVVPDEPVVVDEPVVSDVPDVVPIPTETEVAQDRRNFEDFFENDKTEENSEEKLELKRGNQ